MNRSVMIHKTQLARTHGSTGSNSHSERGLSTIEVIAALLLFSIALLPLVQAQLNAQRGALIVNDIEATAQLERQALNYLESVNFARQPTGQYSFGDGLVRWQAGLIAPEAELIRNADRIGLYRVEVDLIINEVVVSQRVLHSVGWRPV